VVSQGHVRIGVSHTQFEIQEFLQALLLLNL
jgi:hypothetical protein